MTAYTPETQAHLVNAAVALAAGDTDTATEHLLRIVRTAPTADVQRLVKSATAAARAATQQ